MDPNVEVGVLWAVKTRPMAEGKLRRSFVLSPSVARPPPRRRRILPSKSAPVRRKLLSCRREVRERSLLDGRRPGAWEARCPRRAESRLQLPQGAPLPPVWTSSCALHCRPLPYHRHRALSPLPVHPGRAKTTLPEPVRACAWGERLANSTREALGLLRACCATRTYCTQPTRVIRGPHD